MSGLHDLVAGGGECSTSNPMASFMKQFQKDRSLEQDRINAMEAGPLVGKQAFRSTKGKAPNYSQDFFMPESDPLAPMAADQFQFPEMQRELELLPDLPASVSHPAMVGDPALANGNWASEFLTHHRPSAGIQGSHGGPPPDFAEFEQVFHAHHGQPPASVMVGHRELLNEYLKSEPQQRALASVPLDHAATAAFDQAFDHAERRIQADNATISDQDWAQQFKAASEVSAHKPMDTPLPTQASQWVEEFNQMQSDSMAAPATTDDGLAAQASSLLNSLDLENDPKLRKSKFVYFMEKLRDNDFVVEGDQVVDKTKQQDWASEFSQTTGNQPSWTDEFEKRMDARRAEDHADGGMWSQEFAKGLEKNWAEEFETQGGGAASSTAADWAKEFAQDTDFRDIEDAFNNSQLMEEWVDEYRKNIAHLAQDPVDQEWDAMQKQWEKENPAVGMGYRADRDQYHNYAFESDNPFLASDSTLPDDTTIAHMDLGDAILALEARVQQNPQDARAWHSLGIRQQENEQDALAIASLRKAVGLGAGLTNAYIDLAVSYTNENCRLDAYDALESWISSHSKYQSLLGTSATGKPPLQQQKDPHQRHQYIENLYLQAVRQNPQPETMDPDVQVALGVLSHVVEDYDKATDCFQTALNLRPDDYLLWNKLGATLANSRQPQKAMDAYFTALELKPSYIRARYNLAISSINLGLHREAAEHLLGALALQKRSAATMNSLGDQSAEGSAGQPAVGAPAGPAAISSNLWSTLKMTMQILDHPDLAEACDHQSLDEFQGRFDF
ncbi:hypothetical protein H4R34_000377 [Dimargaris verticillata]|uniref:Peroxisomal targeting signal receptor n=1 Tax=Dimargaris verticillata TaxID=2761393 RepID=A0A9W8BBZ0_9FUNG|nr:hypothetical protein H4R34_000377 [Dimargaris verticillata]